MTVDTIHPPLPIESKKELEDDEVICSHCNGTGDGNKTYEVEVVAIEENGIKTSYPGKKNFLPCKMCEGTGKLTWIENVLGKNKVNNTEYILHAGGGGGSGSCVFDGKPINICVGGGGGGGQISKYSFHMNQINAPQIIPPEPPPIRQISEGQKIIYTVKEMKKESILKRIKDRIKNINLPLKVVLTD